MRAIRISAATAAFVVVFVGALILRGTPSESAGISTVPVASDAPGAVEPTVDLDGPKPCATVAVVKQVYADGAEPTTANLAAVSIAVMVATVTSIDPGVWNTPTGSRPEFEDGRPPSSAIIYRPVLITATDTIRDASLGAAVRVRWLGGQAGCEYAGVSNGRPLGLLDDRSYVFFLGPSLDASGQYGDALTILDAWPVDSGELVLTRLEGQVSIGQVKATVDAAPLLLPPLP